MTLTTTPVPVLGTGAQKGTTQNNAILIRNIHAQTQI